LLVFTFFSNSESFEMVHRAVVVFSGGQDSTTVLGHVLKAGFEAHAISFLYGQRHAVELECAKAICARHGVSHKVVDLSFFGKMVTSATTGNGEVQEFGVPHPRMADVPSSFVPNRNALFLTLAHAYAQEVGADTVWTGVCETDYSGYPDCRNLFIKSLEAALNTGYLTNIKIMTPLMYITKAETFKMADEDGFLGEVLHGSHTCYEGDHSTPNEWGFGCGKCPSCKLRAEGWAKYQDMVRIA
jgi:7-cyano-7-deazaguanine synthase